MNQILPNEVDNGPIFRHTTVKISHFQQMDSRSIEEITLNEVLENTVKSYDKVLSSHEDILTAKVSSFVVFLRY